MYSVVLMMALTGSTEAVEFGRHRCNGCDAYACNGCSYNGCGHSSCGYVSCGHNGCDNCGNCGRRGLFHRRNNCCCPPVCGGCAVTCGAVYTCGNNGCGYTGCGYTGCGVAAPVAVPAPPATAPKEMPKTPPATPAPMKTQLNAPATIVVQVAENATLTIDGHATKQTSARRVFVTPSLATGTYTIQVVNGNAVQSREVTVTGGRTTEVNFTTPAAVASR